MYNTHKNISQRFLIIMNELKVNQNQLADLLNVTQPAVSKYLQGRTPPPFVLLELSLLSGRSIEWILTGTNQPIGKTARVAENKNIYMSNDSIENKIALLPTEIRRKIEALIDSIIEEQLAKRT